MQWRRRRFAIAIIGTSLVFAMTLVLSGMSASFGQEIDNTLGIVAADRWVVSAGVSGPFTATVTVPESTVAEIAALPGVTRADPIIVIHQTVRASPDHPDVVTDINAFGFRPGGIGEPQADAGTGLRAPGEAIVDRSLHLDLGGVFAMSGHNFKVVGLVSERTLNAGTPDVFVGIDDAKLVAFGGQPAVSAVVTRGVPQGLPAGLQALDQSAVRADVARPLDRAVTTIRLIVYLLRAVAATIIASVVYLSASERVRDFAVLKATGSSTGSVIAGVAIQAVFLALASALLSVGVARLLVPAFPLGIRIPSSDYVLLPVVALLVGILASIAGARRAVSVDPAAAFSGP